MFPSRLFLHSQLSNPGRQHRRCSTLPILQSFVSSSRNDTFRCESVTTAEDLTIPYVCSYSNEAKSGGRALLAIGTEQGTVHVVDTNQGSNLVIRKLVSQMILQPHLNGIFDIKWNKTASSLATCSGDQSARISSLETGKVINVLNGHSGTVKCVAWNPLHVSLLATGSRDGAIYLWDLRIGEYIQVNNINVTLPTVKVRRAHQIVPQIPIALSVEDQEPYPNPPTVTNVLHSELNPYLLFSSGASDGILRSWDIRVPTITHNLSHPANPDVSLKSDRSPIDPTSRNSRRHRGILGMASGCGPSISIIFALGADSRIHLYDIPSLKPNRNFISHEELSTMSFYVQVSTSPCGRWLACGGTVNTGNSFMFDVENCLSPRTASIKGVEIPGPPCEASSVDWSQNALATCADDGIVRIWRPNPEMYSNCRRQPEEYKNTWNWTKTVT